jgi:DNA primase
VVVEGFFDCFKMHQAGLPCVVALMGCSLSLRQEQLLRERFQEVVLFLDGDRAGRTAAMTIANRLVSKVSIRLIDIPAAVSRTNLTATRFAICAFRATPNVRDNAPRFITAPRAP